MQITALADSDNPIVISFDLDPSKKYGILLSGGLDSAILLFLILREYSAMGVTPNIQPFTIPKTDGSFMYATGVLNYMNERFGLQLAQPILVGDITVNHNKLNASAFEEIFNSGKHDIDLLFNGINQNPPEEFQMRGMYPNRTTVPSASGKVILPFQNNHKTHNLDIMYQIGAEEILNYTHSCTEQTVGRCNVCFQCDERAWALAQIGREDTGTK